MLFDSDWRDWLDRWEANQAPPVTRHTTPFTRGTTAAPPLPEDVTRAGHNSRAGGGRRLLYVAVLLTPTLLIALGIGLGLSGAGRNDSQAQRNPTAATAPVPTAPVTTGPRAATSPAQAWCKPQPANPYISNAGGNTTTPEGLLASMEQQFFGARSTPGVMALVSGGWANAAAISRTITSLPAARLEWCTTVRPASAGWYTVIVEWRPVADAHRTTTWVGDYRVDDVSGVGLRITGMRPNDKVVEELRHKEAATQADQRETR